MQDHALIIWTGQVVAAVEFELATETDNGRVLRLLDAKEYLRRASYCLAQLHCEDSDTSKERKRFMADSKSPTIAALPLH